MGWIYKGKEIEDADIPEGSLGFIYIIRQISTGRKYIGRKLLYRSVTKTIKGKKKKTKADSDWKNYWSSSPTILDWINQNGTSDFTKEILTFVSSKGSLAAAEEYALYVVGALESDEWINQNIRSKVYRSWIKVNEMDMLRESLKSNRLIKGI